MKSGCLNGRAPKAARVQEILTELPAAKRTPDEVKKVFQSRYGESVSKELVTLVRNGYRPAKVAAMDGAPAPAAEQAMITPNRRGRPMLIDSNDLRKVGDLMRAFGGPEKVREFVDAVEACGGSKKVAKVLTAIA